MAFLKNLRKDMNEISKTRELFKTVASGDVKKIRKAVSQGANIHSLNEHGDSLIHEAIKHGRKEMFDYLRDRGVNQDHANKLLIRAIHVASRQKDSYFLQQLLPYVQDINVKDVDGNTAVRHACEAGLVKNFELLIKKGADHTISNKRGRLPLNAVPPKGKLREEFNEVLIKYGKIPSLTPKKKK
ncbi:Ankyrin repeats (many copies) [uncultured archaeon]|nr:Ankyrin repeats (many copies) [uncultured archaeon]